MIYTLTLNPAIDKTVVIPGFTSGNVNRVQSIRTDVGGKGINVSKCLKALECESTVVAFWGGATGAAGAQFLEENGIRQLSVQVQADTRTNLKIIAPDLHQNTDINEPGPEIHPSELDQLLELLDRAINPGDILIMSGSVPRGISSTIYRDIAFRYHQKNVSIYVDADGTCFRYAIEACPHMVKPNVDELSRFAKVPLLNRKEIICAAKQLIHCGVGEVVVSLGEKGALYLNKKHGYVASGLKVPVQSTVGAGDAMVAAFAYGHQYGMSEKQRLQLAIAISAASVMRSGTQPPDIDTIKTLFHQVKIEEVYYDCESC